MAKCKNCGNTLILKDGKCIHCRAMHGEKMQMARKEPTKTGLPPVRTFTVNGASFNMILVEGGTYYMGITPKMAKQMIDRGTDWRKLVPVVSVDTFYVSETLVTQGLWEAVMKDTCISQSCWKDAMGNLLNPSKRKGNDNLPVENVGWDIAQEFISRLSDIASCTFRLPNGSEWEFAARGGNKSKGFEHSGSDIFDEIGWYDNVSHPVKMKCPNELGLYDMSGNVGEWCNDGYFTHGSKSSISYTLSQGAKYGTGSDAYLIGDELISRLEPWMREENIGTKYRLVRGYYNPNNPSKYGKITSFHNVLFREVRIYHYSDHIGFRLALTPENMANYR